MTYTLSGAVTELTVDGVVPVEGVRVEEQSSRRSVFTDANGLYSLSGAYGADTLVSTTKPGYVPSQRTVTMSGNTQLDIRVDRIQSDVLFGEVFEDDTAGEVDILARLEHNLRLAPLQALWARAWRRTAS